MGSAQQCVYVFYIVSEQTAFIFLYSNNRSVFVTKTECGVRTVSLNKFIIIFRRIRKITKSEYYLRPVCLSVRPSVFLSVRMEQLGSHWAAFYEIGYLSIFRKSIQKIKVS